MIIYLAILVKYILAHVKLKVQASLEVCRHHVPLVPDYVRLYIEAANAPSPY